MWGHRARDIHPSFVLGPRPMLRPIITWKKEMVIVAAKSHAEIEKERSTSKYNFQKLPKGKDKYRRLKNGGRTIPGKAVASPLNAPQLTLWPPMNSVAFATPTHRRPKGELDRTRLK